MPVQPKLHLFPAYPNCGSLPGRFQGQTGKKNCLPQKKGKIAPLRPHRANTLEGDRLRAATVAYEGVRLENLWDHLISPPCGPSSYGSVAGQSAGQGWLNEGGI